MSDAMPGDAVTIDNYEEQPVVLDVDHVDKWFKLPTEQSTGLKQAFINWTKGIKGYKKQHVLRDVSFQVHRGEFFGIVGRNGGGKSTLLKIISQIYYPNRGSVHVEGKLVPFIELGVGFNPELTGRENVYLNGALLGFTHDEVDAMYDDIVEFAELEEFMDQKLKNYSSGMQVRLAFSVAIKAQGDILVLDEVLAVGDEAFQRKCDDYFTSIRQDPTKTVILVTHDMGAIKRYCTRAMFIQDGEVAAIGDKETVAERYTLANLEIMREEEARKAERLQQERSEGKAVYPNGLNERCPVLRTYAISPLVLTSDEKFCFAVEYEFNESDDFYLAIALHDIRRGGITFDTGAHNERFHMTEQGHHTVYFEMPLDLFNNGEFRLFTSLRTPIPGNTDTTDMVAVALDDNACTFAIRDPRNMDYALINTRVMQIEPITEEEAQAVAAQTAANEA
ncbi:ABC transporter ATP-binding protein [uncultured Bifidobacterium sp.]|uniref:ABC transporter ATP-binding protein n=1 Tax=uncultured Bifidobacterium sp. TaxID=165187 RepID=UPI0025855FD0|nr:ABC transporter ATP-binding protein [uncultured Bifidobacterium sp.]MEE0653730.1 ABC transporter ATP-binding protein [Bifidobacterium criceti]